MNDYHTRQVNKIEIKIETTKIPKSQYMVPKPKRFRLFSALFAGFLFIHGAASRAAVFSVSKAMVIVNFAEFTLYIVHSTLGLPISMNS